MAHTAQRCGSTCCSIDSRDGDAVECDARRVTEPQDPDGSPFAANLINSIFDVFVLPEIDRRGLALSRFEIAKVTVELDPARPRPTVLINSEAEVVASVRVNRAVEQGQEITTADFDEVENLQPATVGPNSGWVCFAVIKGVEVVAFDFRYNKAQASALISRAEQFLTVARSCADSAPAVACDTGFSAAELSIQAQMLLQQNTTRDHKQRQAWLDFWVEHANSPDEHATALRELHQLRANGRYADAELALPEGRLADLLDVVSEMIEDAKRRAG
jgi:hypothetical protein